MAYTYHKQNADWVIEKLELSADDSDVEFLAPIAGTYLMSVEIVASADDAVTFTINSALGTELFTTTTTGATSGEISNATDRWPIVGTPTWTLSGLDSGTVTIQVVCVGKYR